MCVVVLCRFCFFDKATQMDNGGGHETSLGFWKGFEKGGTEVCCKATRWRPACCIGRLRRLCEVDSSRGVDAVRLRRTPVLAAVRHVWSARNTSLAMTAALHRCFHAHNTLCAGCV